MQEGFTVIELVLVLTLVSIISAVAIPLFIDIGGTTADAAAKKVMADLSSVRRMARNRNNTFSAIFDTTAETYTLVLYDPVANTETTITDPLTQKPMVINFKTAPGLKGVDLQSVDFGGTNKIRFTSPGVPQDGSNANLTTTGTIVLKDGGKTASIIVQPNTGEVSLQ